MCYGADGFGPEIVHIMLRTDFMELRLSVDVVSIVSMFSSCSANCRGVGRAGVGIGMSRVCVYSAKHVLLAASVAAR